MTTTGETLAQHFDAANSQIIQKVGALPDESWDLTAPEGWPVGVTVHHIAESYEGLAGMVQTIATGGQFPPLTQEMLDKGNAQHAIRAAGVTKAETLQLLHEWGRVAAAMLRSLTDEQLATTAPMPLAGQQEMSAAEVAESVLIGHGKTHFAGVEATTA